MGKRRGWWAADRQPSLPLACRVKTEGPWLMDDPNLPLVWCGGGCRLGPGERGLCAAPLEPPGELVTEAVALPFLTV